MNDRVEDRLAAYGSAVEAELGRRPLIARAGDGVRPPRPWAAALTAVAAAVIVVAAIVGLVAARGSGDRATSPTTTRNAGVGPAGAGDGPAGAPWVSDPSAPWPSTTVGGGPVESSPPTTSVSPAGSVVLLGDSVSASGVEALLEVGIERVGVTSMAGGFTIDELDEVLARQGTVVVAIGADAAIAETDIVELLTRIGGIRRVVVLTVHSDAPYADRNNELLREAALEADAVLLDWNALAEACPAGPDCFQEDGTHLAPEGARYYAALIAAVTGVGESAGSVVVPPAPTFAATICPDGSTAPTHQVAVGDSYNSIAEAYGLNLEELVEASGVGINDVLIPGQQLYLPCDAPESTCPDGSERATYTIVEGDVPALIAEKLDVPLSRLEAVNAANPAWDTFIVGSELVLPC